MSPTTSKSRKANVTVTTTPKLTWPSDDDDDDLLIQNITMVEVHCAPSIATASPKRVSTSFSLTPGRLSKSNCITGDDIEVIESIPINSNSSDEVEMVDTLKTMENAIKASELKEKRPRSLLECLDESYFDETPTKIMKPSPVIETIAMKTPEEKATVDPPKTADIEDMFSISSTSMEENGIATPTDVKNTEVEIGCEVVSPDAIPGTPQSKSAANIKSIRQSLLYDFYKKH